MIQMAGIDYNLAPLEVREALSFTGDMLVRAYARIRDMPGLDGAVIVSTCNRTELYTSSNTEVDVFELLCTLAGTDSYEDLPYYGMSGAKVLRHLAMLACGDKSQIWGEDQILTQVKTAIAQSREHGVACGVLEVLFREAVAAAKKIKTRLRPGAREDSIIYRALDVIKRRGGIKNVLVIGNGEIGRSMTRALIENGYAASMTLRTYRHGETLVPAGASTVDYANRYEVLADFDVLISATRSPHHTIEAARLAGAYPPLMLDLAVPRDIDPGVVALPGVEYHNVDTLGASDTWRGRDDFSEQAVEILDKYASDFERWMRNQTTAAERQEYFPLFVPTTGKCALIVGGGKIASRRAVTLSRFGFDITVVAPEVSPELEKLADSGRLTVIPRAFEPGDLDGCFLVIAATDDREVNREIGVLASERGILASVADRRDECGFLFPAIAVSGDIVAGITSGGRSPSAAREAAKKVREALQA